MILGCGESVIDMIPSINTEGFPVFLPVPGGSPYNTAIAVARLGVPVSFMGRFSRDFFGQMLIRRLEENRVGTELIIRSDEHSSLAFVKIEKDREPEYLFYTQGTADRSFSTADIPHQFTTEPACIYFGSIARTMEPAASAIEQFVQNQSAQPDGPVISMDPNIRPFMIADRNEYVKRFERWVQAVHIVKISEADIAFIYPELNLSQAVEKLLQMGPLLAAVTLGPKGALACVKTSSGSMATVQAPAIPVTVVDTIGAGDTFHGSFLSWLHMKGKMSRQGIAGLETAELQEALTFANKAASLVCTRRGAEPPTMAEMLKAI
ncbi:MAG: carbohydrate kinase [Spirochaetaceae bacterium]|nr:carbohydrate kinase [Spirochaetaceae bacterium]